MEQFQTFILVAPVLLLSMVAHEWGHAYAALRQGDDTAQRLGRVTWDPRKHIDPVFTIVVPALTFLLSSGSFIFGGAKPVPVDPRRYRSYVKGDLIVSLAGVTMNLLLAVALTGAMVVAGLLAGTVPAMAEGLARLQGVLVLGIFFNVLLLVFNLIPIPPLDGSHVLKHVLPPAWALRYQRFAGAGLLLLLGMFWIGGPVPRALLAPVFFLTGLAREVWGPFIIGTGMGS